MKAPLVVLALLPAAFALPVEPAGAVTVRYSMLQSEASPEGVVLRWAFDKAAELPGIRVERATQQDGPWSPLPGEPRREGEHGRFVDSTAPPRSTCWYRLVASGEGGEGATFGPIAGSTRGLPKKLEITALAPNPTPGSLVIDYAVPRPGRLKVLLVDVEGHVVATLVDGERAAGLYRESWVAAFGKNAAPGLHFVRLDLAGKKTSRSVILEP